MSAGLRHRELVERFRRERQILARLTHPDIAPILDGGVTDDGRPYLVMPYVEGQPITDYCDAADLDLRRRLELFLVVCDAVQHAHGHLVVHRDLKPSNISVTDDGAVKLLDFGIAKLIEPRSASPADAPPSTPSTPSTAEEGPDDPAPAPDGATELRLMTPEHAAPEQIAGDAVTTATDVWALGALLYQLLTGRKPFPAGGSGRAELERAICEVDPAPPSAAASASGASPAAVRSLRGDLDAVVLHALAKAPGDRYGSAEQLADDVRRHLRREPVRVRPSTVGYRGGRFLRRYAWQSAAAVALAALVVAFAVSSALQSRALQRERDAARLDQETAEQVTGVLVDLFETTDPVRTPGGRSMTVEELLD
ncbi:MAG: serine/threonine-protein kinase, partial [Acidobacteriota bacterium]